MLIRSFHDFAGTPPDAAHRLPKKEFFGGMGMRSARRRLGAFFVCAAVCLMGLSGLTGCEGAGTGGRCVLPVFPFSAEGRIVCGESSYPLTLVFDSPSHGRMTVGDAVFLVDGGVTLDAGGLLLPLSHTPDPVAFAAAVFSLTPEALISCASDGERVTAEYRAEEETGFGTIVLTSDGDRVVSARTEGFRMELS